MPKRFPPLTPDEVRAILRAWGFTHVSTTASHEHWVGIVHGRAMSVTVDAHYPQFDASILKLMIEQSGLSREQFYCATKRSAGRASGFCRRFRREKKITPSIRLRTVAEDSSWRLRRVVYRLRALWAYVRQGTPAGVQSGGAGRSARGFAT